MENKNLPSDIFKSKLNDVLFKIGKSNEIQKLEPSLSVYLNDLNSNRGLSIMFESIENSVTCCNEQKYCLQEFQWRFLHRICGLILQEGA